MRLIGEQLGRRGGIYLTGAAAFGPGLTISAASIAENSAPGTSIGTLSVSGGVGPFIFDITSDPDAKFDIGGAGSDELVIKAGASLNYEVKTAHQVYIQITDAGDGDATYTRHLTIAVTDVADGPTATGAASTLDAALGTPTVGVEITFDARDILVSPTGQNLIFLTDFGGFGVVDADGFTVRWTPTATDALIDPTTFTLRAYDEDSQFGSATSTPFTISTVNLPPAGGDITATYEVPEDVTAPVLTSPVGTKTGPDTATVGATTDEANGTITYGVFLDAATTPDAAQLLAGTDGDDAPLVLNPSVAVTATGAQTRNVTGLTAATAYRSAAVHVDVAGRISNVVSSAAFTTDAGAAPSQFGTGDWSIADAGTNQDAEITITALPGDGGSAITDLQYQIDGGSWVSLGGTTTGTYTVAGFTDGTPADVAIRAVNANGNGTASATKSVTATGVPAAFTAGMWTLTDLTTGGDARISISSLPASNGSALTDLEYKKDAGAWTSLGGATTGDYDLTGVFTDGVAADVIIRAVNANGSGADSDTKSVTTTTSSSGITGHDAPVKVIDSGADQSTPYTGTIPSVASGDRLYIAVAILASNSSGLGGDPAGWTVTVNGGGALTPDDFVAASQLYNGLALYSLDAPATGDLTLSVTPSGAARGCAAWAWKIKGHNTGTPHPSAPDAVKNESAVATIVHPNGLSVADGDVVLGVVGVKGGDVTALGVTGADGSSTDETGTTGFSDIEHGVCWKKQSGAGTVTFDWDWTSADGVVAGYWRIQKA